jgi:hypothetical protein
MFYNKIETETAYRARDVSLLADPLWASIERSESKLPLAQTTIFFFEIVAGALPKPQSH